MFLKEAWRNYVMHVGDVYDEGKAFSVLTNVRMVMQAQQRAVCMDYYLRC